MLPAIQSLKTPHAKLESYTLLHEAYAPHSAVSLISSMVIYTGRWKIENQAYNISLQKRLLSIRRV